MPHALRCSIDRALVLEQQIFVGAVRDRHDVDVLELRARLAPVTMRQDMMAAHFAARFHFAPDGTAQWNKRIETRHPHAAGRGLHMLEETWRNVR